MAVKEEEGEEEQKRGSEWGKRRKIKTPGKNHTYTKNLANDREKNDILIREWISY